MLNQSNANKYVQNNLKSNGIAVLNVGGRSTGCVYIYKKDKEGKVKTFKTRLCVIFQEDQKP